MESRNFIQPIFITGVQRSGSSIIAKIVNMSGVYTGVTDKMFENKNIKEYIESYYKNIGYDPKAQYPLPDRNNLPQPKNLKNDLRGLLHHYKDSQKWLYKSSKLCQTWSIWHKAFPEARWIIVRRKPSDIVYSCIKTMYMTAFASNEIQKRVGVTCEREGWLYWIKQHDQMFEEMVNAGVNYRVIWPEDLVDGNYSNIEHVMQWLELPFDLQSVKKEIDPLLWKSRVNRKEL